MEKLRGPPGQAARMLAGLARSVYLFHTKMESMIGCGKASVWPNLYRATNGAITFCKVRDTERPLFYRDDSACEKSDHQRWRNGAFRD